MSFVIGQSNFFGLVLRRSNKIRSNNLTRFVCLHSTAVQLSQSAYFALQCPYTVFGLGRTPNFVDKLAVGMPRAADSVRIDTFLVTVLPLQAGANQKLFSYFTKT